MLAIASRRRTQVVKGEVCKTSMQRFESARRLHSSLIKPDRSQKKIVDVWHVSSLGLSSEQTVEFAGHVQPPRIVVTTYRLSIDKDLRHGAPP